MRSGSLRNERGFALLEAVLALAILAVVTVAVLAHMGADMRTSARIRDVLPAVALAEHRLAVLELLPAAELEALPDSLSAGRFAPPLDRYAWSAMAEPMLGRPGLYEVVVEVSWPEGGSYPLRTRVYRPPDEGAQTIESAP